MRINDLNECHKDHAIHRNTEPCSTFSQGGVQSSNAFHGIANTGHASYSDSFIMHPMKDDFGSYDGNGVARK